MALAEARDREAAARAEHAKGLAASTQRRRGELERDRRDLAAAVAAWRRGAAAAVRAAQSRGRSDAELQAAARHALAAAAQSAPDV